MSSRYGSARGCPCAPKAATRPGGIRPTDRIRLATRHRAAPADDTLVAVAVLTHDGRKGWINRLAVDPIYRRQGLARRLVAEAERWFAQDLGLEVWAALIERHNDASLSLFDELGYGQPDVAYVSKRLRGDA